MFTYEPVDGLTVHGQSNEYIYGCIDGIQWDIRRVIRSLNAWSPKVDFSEEGAGNYRVVLTLGGPGGSTSIK